MNKKGINPIHTVLELRQMQSLPLSVKIKKTELRIKEWYEYWGGDVYVSFSGGKDSTVLLDIVRRIYPDVPAVYIDTGLEYPEVRSHALSTENIMILHPMRYDKEKREWIRTNFKEVLFSQGYPVVSKEVAKVLQEAKRGIEQGEGKYQNSIQKLNGVFLDKNGNKSKYNCPKWKFMLDAPFKVSNKCCNIMKKNPAHLYEKETGRHRIVGTMADESALRLQTWLYDGCNAFENKSPTSQPLSFWRESDILEYLLVYNIPYAKVYGDIIGSYGELTFTKSQLLRIRENAPNDWRKIQLSMSGVSRTGCMFCGFGVHLEKEPNRYQRMRETHPKMWDYCFKSKEQGGLGFSDVMDYMGVNYK